MRSVLLGISAIMVGASSFSLAPLEWRARRRIASKKEAKAVRTAVELQRGVLEFERARFEAEKDKWALAPSPFALSQSFRAQDFPDIVGTDASTSAAVLLHLADGQLARAIVADAATFGLGDVSLVVVPSGTRVLVQGGTRALKQFVRSFHENPSVTITWGADGTALLR